MSQTEFPTQPGSGPSLPPPPEGPTPGGPWSGGPPAEPRRRRRSAVLVAAGVALALVAGGTTYALLRTRTPSGPATSLRLAFDRGDRATYDMHMTMDGSMDLGTAGTQPLSMDLSESVAWQVVKVSADGTATVHLSVQGVSGSLNGQPVPSAGAQPAMTLRITPDGQIVGADGASFGSVGSPMGGFPGMDQVTPILPDHPVAPGDEWDKRFSQKLPFGDASIEYTAHSTFERYERMGGVRAAVISTRYTAPMNFSLDLGQLAKAFGGSSGMGGMSGPGEGQATITYEGSGTFTQTSWLDLERKELLKGATEGGFDLKIGFPGLAAQLGTDHVSMSGTFSLQLTRR